MNVICIYDNPSSMRRECYKGGSLLWGVSVEIIFQKHYAEYHHDYFPWVAGTLRGDYEALPHCWE